MFTLSLDWFPKCKKDLDVFANKVLEAGRELKNDDHPVSLTTRTKIKFNELNPIA